MIPQRITIRTNLTQEQILDKIESLTDLKSYRWYDKKHLWNRTYKRSTVYVGSVDRNSGTFSIHDQFDLGDKQHIVFNGSIVDCNNGSAVRTWIRSSAIAQIAYNLLIIGALYFTWVATSMGFAKFTPSMVLAVFFWTLILTTTFLFRRVARKAFTIHFS